MKRTFKMPAPQLSYLKEVNIDLDMTGRHYALLGTTSDISPIHFQYGAIARLKPGENQDIYDVVYDNLED